MDSSPRPVSVDPSRINVRLGNASGRTVVDTGAGLKRTPEPKATRPNGRPKKEDASNG